MATYALRYSGAESSELSDSELFDSELVSERLELLGSPARDERLKPNSSGLFFINFMISSFSLFALFLLITGSSSSELSVNVFVCDDSFGLSEELSEAEFCSL